MSRKTDEDQGALGPDPSAAVILVYTITHAPRLRRACQLTMRG